MSTVLITGAGGYVGGRLTRAFLEDGWDVRAVVREYAPRLEVPQSKLDLAADGTGDDLVAELEGVDSVVHLAGEDEVTAAAAPATALASTIVATERVATACATAGVRRVVYLSTMHVYGARVAPGATLVEDMRADPRSAYGISRLACEQVAASHADGYALVVFRLTNSVGAPYDPAVNRWTLVANDLCRQGALSGRLELRSSGMQWRDFVPLSDVCSALIAAADPQDRLAPGTYNLGSGRPLRVRELAQMIQDCFERRTGSRPELTAPAPESAPPGPFHVSVKRAAAQGLQLETPLEPALMETVDFCLEHAAELP